LKARPIDNIKISESDMKKSMVHTDEDGIATNQSSHGQFMLSKDRDEEETRIKSKDRSDNYISYVNTTDCFDYDYAKSRKTSSLQQPSEVEVVVKPHNQMPRPVHRGGDDFCTF